MKAGILQVFKDRVPPDTHRAVVGAFDGELVVDTGEDVTDDAYVALIDRVPALKAPVDALISEEEAASSPAMVASACEMVLEGLHLAKRLNKDAVGGRPVPQSGLNPTGFTPTSRRRCRRPPCEPVLGWQAAWPGKAELPVVTVDPAVVEIPGEADVVMGFADMVERAGE